jgi:hypothetical protein
VLLAAGGQFVMATDTHDRATPKTAADLHKLSIQTDRG